MAEGDFRPLSDAEVEARVRSANPLNDALFKHLFASKENSENLLRLLNDTLGPERRIVDVEYLDRENDPGRFSGKLSYLDVLARSEDGRIFHVEVQLADESNFMERAVYYAVCSLGDQLSSGDDYTALRPVVFVSLLKFVLFPDKPAAWHSMHRLLDVENHRCYSDVLEFHFLEFPKLERRVKERNVEDTGLSRLLRYLGRMGGEAEMERLAEQDVGIERLRRGERSFFREPGNLALYRLRERAETDYLNALKNREERGRAKGEAKARADMARRMLSMDLTPEQIAQATGLPLGEIEGMRQTRGA